MMWFFGPRKSAAVKMAERAFDRLETVQKQLRKDLKEIRSLEARMSKMQRSVLLISETTAEDIEDAQKKLRYAEKAMEALRSEHEIDAEAVIPLMSKRLKEMEASSEASIAVANQRRAGATPVRFDGEI